MTRIGPFRVHYKAALLAILVLAAVLRFAGLNWDDGYYLHPDERFMVMVTTDTAWPESVGQYFDTATSPLNPYNTRHGTFIYGTFPMFLTKAVSTLVGKDVYGETHLAGRAISALADTGTVFLVAWIARRFFGRSAGLLAGLLFAGTVLHVQTAHYYTVDSISVFFATAAFATTVKAWDRRSFGWFATAGLMIGLAGASKPNYLIALAFLGLPVAEAIRRHGIDGLWPWSDGEIRRFPVLPAVALSGLVAFWTFRIAQPYAFAGPTIWHIGLNRRWLDDLSYWRSAQSGLIDIKSSVQWADRTPVLYILDNLVRWGMGPPLGIAALVALAMLAVRLIGARTWPSWWMLGIGGWCVSQIALYGLNIAQAQRYLMPVYPFLVVLAAGFLVELAGRLHVLAAPSTPVIPSPSPVIPSAVEGSLLLHTNAVGQSQDPSTPLGGLEGEVAKRSKNAGGPLATSRARDDSDRGFAYNREKWRPLRFLGPALIAITVVYTLFYAVAFDTLFVRPISRVQASEWIYENVPTGSTLTAEYWDDALPMRLEGEDASRYRVITLDLYAYEGPGSLKLSKLIGQLNQADYIILSSNRIIGSVPRQPERYPMASHYYEMLLNGDLGFDLVAEFQQKPELLGIAFNDVNAEETLTVYEHPYVRIFQKTPSFDAHQVYNGLAEALGYGGVNYLPGDPTGDQMLLSPDEQAQVDASGTWRTKFDPGSLSNQFPVVWWYLAMQLMIVPALPLCWILFRRFPDHGYALAKVFGLLAVTWIAWLLAALDLVDFSPFSIALAWLILLLAGTILARSQLVDMTRAWRARWRWLVATEALFLVAFAGAGWLRALDPAFWHPTGSDQSPFWYAIFNASARAGTFPAYDPWLSGGKLHLANWGQMPWVTLTRLTGILPETAWNLAFAGIVALAATTLWSAAAALAHRIGCGSPARAGWIALLAPVATLSGATLATRDATASDGNPLTALLAGNLDSLTTTLPIIALLIAVTVAIATPAEHATSRQWPFTGADIVRIMLGGMLAGAMLASSTWGFLPAIAMVAAGLIVRTASAPETAAWPPVRNTVVLVALAGVSAYVAFWPAISAITITKRDQRTGPATDLPEMLAMFAVPLVLLLPWVTLRAFAVLRTAREEDAVGRIVTGGSAILALLMLAGAFMLESSLLFLMVALFLAILAAWQVRSRPGELLVLGLSAIALGAIVLSGTMPATADPFGGNSARFLGGYTWLLLGIVVPALVAWFVRQATSTRHRTVQASAAIWLGTFGLVLAIGLASPFAAIRDLRESSAGAPRTLDATTFTSDAPSSLDFDADRQAAQWLRTRVDGLPVLLEGTTSDFQPGGRISAMTGLPAVIGWTTPERMTRPGWTELVSRRQDAVRQVYGSRGDFASIEPLLREYGVDLIYVGPVERAIYPDAALRKFDSAVADGSLAVIYQSGPVTIYAYSP